jgi:hypothetical protein
MVDMDMAPGLEGSVVASSEVPLEVVAVVAAPVGIPITKNCHVPHMWPPGLLHSSYRVLMAPPGHGLRSFGGRGLLLPVPIACLCLSLSLATFPLGHTRLPTCGGCFPDAF